LPQILRHRWRCFLRRWNKAINVLIKRCVAFVTLTKNRFSSCQCFPSSSSSLFLCSMVKIFFFNHPPPILPLRLPSLASVPFEISIVAPVIACITKIYIYDDNITSFLLFGVFLVLRTSFSTFFVMGLLLVCVFFYIRSRFVTYRLSQKARNLKHPLL